MASEAPTATSVPAKPNDAVACIARQVDGLLNGDHAALRRIYLTKDHAADGVVQGMLYHAGVRLPDNMADYVVAFRPWRLLAHVAALLSGTTRAESHRAGKPFGVALHEAGYKELRFLRLTAARGEQLHRQIVHAVRIVKQADKGPFDLWTILHLAGTDQTRVEEARLRIVRDYYAADARSEGKTK